jgi:hypothetical protein
MSKAPSPRVLELFARVEETAERLTGIVAEERQLRQRLRHLWEEKANVVATLADESRNAALTDIGEALKRQRKGSE